MSDIYIQIPDKSIVRKIATNFGQKEPALYTHTAVHTPRMFRLDQVGDAPIAPPGDLGDHRIAVQSEVRNGASSACSPRHIRQ